VADIAAIREALRARLATLAGTGGQSSAYMLSNPTPPCLQVVGIDATDYDTTFGRGGDAMTMIVQGFAGNAADVAAQVKLDEWLDTTGATSLKAAIETERPSAVTLGGLVSSCLVVSSTGHRVFTLPNGTDVVGAEWTLEIEI
jgi:hypothetical protein